MNKQTVAQRAELCPKLILAAIKASSAGLTIRALQAALSKQKTKVLQQDLRTAVDRLEQMGMLEFEQGRSDTKIYFLPSKPPRHQVRRVPAASLPKLHIPPRNWFASLGAVA